MPRAAELEAIYRRLGPPIYRRCLKILRRHDEAADATQEVFVRILRHQSRLPPEPEQLRWAYTVATRVCLNRLRDAGPENPAPAPTDGGEELVSSTPGAEWASHRQLAARVLARHDETTRAIAWLVLVDGMTQEEAGELLGLSRKTVGKRLQRFLTAARRLLAAEAV